MSKHASSGSSSHPLVAAAQTHRTGDAGAHRNGRPAQPEHPIGWPAPPASPGGRLGWPADAGRPGT